MSENSKNTPQRKDRQQGNPNNLYWIYAFILLIILSFFFFMPGKNHEKEITESKFYEELVPQNAVKRITIVNEKDVEVKIVEVYLNPSAVKPDQQKKSEQRSLWGGEEFSYYFKTISSDELVKVLKQNKIPYAVAERVDYFSGPLQLLLPIAILVAIYIFFMRRISGGMGGSQIFNIGKSKASLFDKENKVKITFSDVAGLEEAKEEVEEVVEFLKNPQKFTRLGGHIPKGVLLVGPPGTGKTLLAKAVAGEAQVPFFSLSGSDFVEMFVGVGAARVRDLFKQAKEKAPCIIFIDEIDAIGRSRGRGNFTGANDERENTLNQLLVEMDGFNTDSGVIMMAATNRPDILDKALLRPGRFDRMIAVDRPDMKEREQIFKVHLQSLVKATDVDAQKLAIQTVGFVGADIMNVCNEAALIAARKNKSAVDMDDFHDAIDRVIGGLEKKSRIILPEEKKVVAYHEAGHALCGWFLPNLTDSLVKVSIIPRGVAALGFAQYLPEERYLENEEQIIDKMIMALGGRAAEEIVFGKVSTGAQSDLEKVTRMAYNMITIYGMSPKVGNVSFVDRQGEEFVMGKPYSEDLAKVIDEEARERIEKAYLSAKKLLTEKRVLLDRIATALLQKEVIFQNDLEELLGSRPRVDSEANQKIISVNDGFENRSSAANT